MKASQNVSLLDAPTADSVDAYEWKLSPRMAIACIALLSGGLWAGIIEMIALLR